MSEASFEDPGRMTARTRGIAYACGVVALFSGFVIASRFGLSTVLELQDIAALRFGIGGLLLSPILLKNGLSGLRLTEAVILATLGGLGFALFAYAGFALAPAAHGAVLLHGTLSLSTALLIWASGSGAVRRQQKAGLAVIALGILAVIWDGVAQASITLLAGDFCLLLASLFWSGYGLYVKRLGLPAVRAAANVAVISALIFLPAYALLPGKMLLQAHWQDLLVQGIFQGILIGAVSIFVYTRAVALLGADKVAFFATAVPGITAIAGFFLLGETLNLSSVIGVGLVTFGMLVALR
ncbi:drug/metabolite transporter (DMT)-like permease [Aminobacter lissarensis]|uniref:Drug/metabolite transporter (DMT)-like permease n=1 Tax=Aminobacter carboxidus TaxID=376165 RepID=A0A8E1WFM8_9HYPH|nr:DMT family transporter [Aminobacter lissarensis]MBB6467985.1 drug/metabolite transporter (DMT)-like permease [Aminobacter lissarensis]